MSEFDDLIDSDSDDYSENDTFARRNLEDHFAARYWRIMTGRNPDSGREDGRDWIIAAKGEKGTLIGFEFDVQSKALSSKEKLLKRYIWDEISVKTIRYLMELPARAAIHLYDRHTKVGYIRWVDEWLKSTDCPKNWDKEKPKSKKKAVTVKFRIPRTCELNSERVKEIRSRLIHEAGLQRLNRHAQLINTDYGSKYRATVTPGTTPNLTIMPLNDAARPILGLDNRDLEKLRVAAITEQPQSIQHPFKVSNFPLNNIEFEGNIASAYVFFPNTDSAASFYSKIDYLDDKKDLILSSNWVEFREKIITDTNRIFLGKDEGKYVKYVVEKTATKTSFTLKFDATPGTSSTVAKLLEIEHLVNAFIRTKYLKITNLKTQETMTVPFKPDIELLESNWAVFSLARALNTIQEATGISITIPEEFTSQEIDFAHEIAGIFQSGRLTRIVGLGKLPNDPNENLALILDMGKDDSDRLQSDIIKDSGELDWTRDNRTATLFGNEIPLGSSRDCFRNCQVVRVEDLPSEEGETSPKVRLIITFDYRNSFTIFEDYYRHNSGELDSS